MGDCKLNDNGTLVMDEQERWCPECRNKGERWKTNIVGPRRHTDAAQNDNDDVPGPPGDNSNNDPQADDGGSGNDGNLEVTSRRLATVEPTPSEKTLRRRLSYGSRSHAVVLERLMEEINDTVTRSN